MKLKTLIVMAMTGLFAASLATAATDVTGDDIISSNNMQTATTSGNVGSMSGMDSPDASAPDSATAPADANSDMSADTATGDDDY